MVEDDFLKDDFLKELIGKQPLDSPSDDFTENVMAGIRLAPEYVPERKPFWLYVRASLPYAAIALIVIIFFISSDLPYSKFLPGKEYFRSLLIPYLGNLYSGFVSLFSLVRSGSLPLAVIASGSLLFLLDRIFFRNHTMQHLFPAK